MTSARADDSLSMFDAAAGLPEQFEEALAASTDVVGLPAHDEIENVIVLGMGGSGITGDVVASVAGPFMPVPVVVQKGYAAPQFVNDRSLVFAVSFSGNTEETLEAASIAAFAGARIVTVSTGGQLADAADEWGSVHMPVDATIPMPRAAIGALTVPVLAVLEAVGMFPGAAGWIAQAIDQLRSRRDELVRPGSMAEELARRVDAAFPIIYGGASLGAVAASRWKNQFNENAKVPAFCSEITELSHNEVCGWGQHGDVTRQVFRLIMLRHDHEHPQVARRFGLVGEATEEAVAGIEEVRASGEGALAQLFDLMLIGDFVTLHAAVQRGVDPGPVPILDEFKERLAQS